jgi:phosphoglucomutase
VDGERAAAMIQRLRDQINANELANTDLGNGLVIKAADDFTYTDPIDGSVSKNQVGIHANSSTECPLMPRHIRVYASCLRMDLVSFIA